MYSKKRTLNTTASSSVNKKKKNAEVPETSTNKKIVSATEKIKVPVTTSLTKKVPVTTSSVEKVLAATTSAKKSKVPVNTSSVMGSLRLNQLKVIEDNCIMICTLFIKLFIFFDIASLNKILRQNAYIIKKIDAALSNKKKD